MQKIITLDSQILNTVSACEMKSKFTFIDSIYPVEKAEALERGDLMHKLLEIYEGLRCNLVDPKSKTWQEVAASGIELPGADQAFDFAITVGRYLATKMDLSVDSVEEIFHQFSEYIDYYKDDPWETLALEAVGTKLLYQDDYVRFLYAFKIDRLAKRDKIIAPWDYKTSKKRTDTSSLSNQFIGYAWATSSNYVVVDKIGFQKTLGRSERFQRIMLPYDKERIDEWQRNAVRWAFAYAEVLRSPEKALMNLTSCDKYSGCVYKSICEASPSAREWIIDRQFKREEKWDPSKVLENANNTN